MGSSRFDFLASVLDEAQDPSAGMSLKGHDGKAPCICGPRPYGDEPVKPNCPARLAFQFEGSQLYEAGTLLEQPPALRVPYAMNSTARVIGSMDVTHRDWHGRTPLYFAAQNGGRDRVAALVERGPPMHECTQAHKQARAGTRLHRCRCERREQPWPHTDLASGFQRSPRLRRHSGSIKG